MEDIEDKVKIVQGDPGNFSQVFNVMKKMMFTSTLGTIRYAHMIGPNVRTPGHWAPPMIDAILGKPTECIYGTPESAISMIYVRDSGGCFRWRTGNNSYKTFL